jgi:hypothetical protein
VSVFCPDALKGAKDEEGCFNFEGGALIVACPLGRGGGGGLIDEAVVLGLGWRSRLTSAHSGSLELLKLLRRVDVLDDIPKEAAAIRLG